MDFFIYFAILLPAVIMIFAGIWVSKIRQENTMKSHHFASDFNIKRYTGKVIKLFVICGLLFSLSGVIVVKLSFLGGFIMFAIVTVLFAIVFSRIIKKG